jgi:hypothetical protein
VDVLTLLSEKENAMFRSRAKYTPAVVGSKREQSYPGEADDMDVDLAMPLSAFPWNQTLVVQDSYSLPMLGRMLRVALTFWNEHCTFCQVTGVQVMHLQSEQSTLDFDFL